jgi:hypothetical protein
LNITPKLSINQFLSIGFTKNKSGLIFDVIIKIQTINKQLSIKHKNSLKTRIADNKADNKS